MDTVCLNGEFVALDAASVPATDGGLLLGEGVFETIRAEQGHPLFLAAHLARLARGARVLGIPLHPAADEIAAWCEAILDANGHRDARLRLTLTRGPLRNHPIDPREGEPTFLVTASALDDAIPARREAGWRLLLAPFPRSHRSPLASIKSTCYAEPLLARRHALARGFDEALFLNTDGRVAEAAMANLFIVRRGELLTPPVADGALPGTARARLLEAAPSCGLQPREATLTLEEVVAAEEVLCTNALIEVMPVVQLGERQISSGAPGRHARALHQALRRRVQEELAARWR